MTQTRRGFLSQMASGLLVLQSGLWAGGAMAGEPTKRTRVQGIGLPPGGSAVDQVIVEMGVPGSDYDEFAQALGRGTPHDVGKAVEQVFGQQLVFDGEVQGLPGIRMQAALVSKGVNRNGDAFQFYPGGGLDLSLAPIERKFSELSNEEIADLLRNWPGSSVEVLESAKCWTKRIKENCLSRAEELKSQGVDPGYLFDGVTQFPAP